MTCEREGHLMEPTPQELIDRMGKDVVLFSGVCSRCHLAEWLEATS